MKLLPLNGFGRVVRWMIGPMQIAHVAFRNLTVPVVIHRFRDCHAAVHRQSVRNRAVPLQTHILVKSVSSYGHLRR